MGIIFYHCYCPGKTLNSGRLLSQESFVLFVVFILIFFIFFFLPQPAEYGAEELFVLDAVPTLGLVRDFDGV